jgi:hypothetical protein
MGYGRGVAAYLLLQRSRRSRHPSHSGHGWEGKDSCPGWICYQVQGTIEGTVDAR